jgi:hypothetical protein
MSLLERRRRMLGSVIKQRHDRNHGERTKAAAVRAGRSNSRIKRPLQQANRVIYSVPMAGKPQGLKATCGACEHERREVKRWRLVTVLMLAARIGGDSLSRWPGSVATFSRLPAGLDRL